MADTKISDLTADASPSSDDLIVTVNDPGGTPANRKVTLANMASFVTSNQSLQVEPSEGGFANGDKTKLDGIESGATADQTNVEIETAYNAQVSQISAGEKTAGTETAVRRFAPQDIHDMIDTHAPGAAGGDAWGDAVDANIVPDADGTRDLGSTSNRFGNLHVDSIDLNGTTLDGTTLAAPGVDSGLFYDVSASDTVYWTPGTGLEFSGTSLQLSITPVDTSGTPVTNDFARFTDADTIEGRSYSEVRADLSLEVGTDVQAYDAALASIAGLTTAADRMIYTTAADTYAVATLTAAGRALLDDADASAQRTTLGLAIGTDVQAYDADTLKADTADVLTAGFAHTVYNAGTQTTGTFTPDEANGNIQRAVNGGAHTLAPPINDCTIIIQYTNNASAGAITVSGFTKTETSEITTTDGDDFFFYITKANGFSSLRVEALQ